MGNFIFDDDATPAVDGLQMDAADDRTLRLAAPPLTPERLEALFQYQEAFLARAEAAPGDATALAEAHAAGLAGSPLPPQHVEALGALVRAFAARRSPVARLQARLAGLQGQQDAKAQELRTRIQTELRRLDRTDALARRYGEDAVGVMMAHEGRLLALQARLAKVLG